MSPTTNRPVPVGDTWRSGWRLTYTTGSWLALAGPSAAVLLQPASAQWSQLIGTIWEEVLHAEGIEDLLERMASFRLEGMPSFGALFWGADGVRSLVRGAIRLLDADTGAVLIDGAGVQTWTETALAGHDRIRVSTDPGNPAGGSQLELPLIVGAAAVADLIVETAPHRQVGSSQLLGEAEVAPSPSGFAGSDSLTDSLEPVDPAEIPVRASADESIATAPAPMPPAPTAPAPTAPAPASGRGWDPTLDGHTLIAPSLPGTPPVPVAGAVPAGVPTGAAAAGNENGADESEYGHTVLAPNLPGGRPLPPPPPPRQVVAVLSPSSGGQIEVDRPVLIGRAPSANRVSSGQLPRLLTVPSPSHDISRTHLQVAPGDGQVLVTDMNSTNGTIVITADGTRLTLEPSTPHPVEPGAVIDLGDGITIMVEPAATEPLPGKGEQ